MWEVCMRSYTRARIHVHITCMYTCVYTRWTPKRARNTCRTIAVTRSLITTRRSRERSGRTIEIVHPVHTPWSALPCTTASLHPAVHSRGFPREWDFTGEINSALSLSPREEKPRARPSYELRLNIQASTGGSCERFGMTWDWYHGNTHLPLFVRCIVNPTVGRTSSVEMLDQLVPLMCIVDWLVCTATAMCSSLNYHEQWSVLQMLGSRWGSVVIICYRSPYLFLALRANMICRFFGWDDAWEVAYERKVGHILYSERHFL